jgi:hypothetical protein
MAYNNVNKRILNLAEEGLIEEAKISESIHGRKDFKLTIKGLEHLMPHIITHPEDAKMIIEYMDRFELNKQVFSDMLVSEVASMVNSANQYLGSIGQLGLVITNKTEWDGLRKAMSDLHELVSGKPKTVIRLSEEVQASDSVDAKAAHALRVSASKPSSKKKERFG